jgi:hypothetical protein
MGSLNLGLIKAIRIGCRASFAGTAAIGKRRRPKSRTPSPNSGSIIADLGLVVNAGRAGRAHVFRWKLGELNRLVSLARDGPDGSGSFFLWFNIGIGSRVRL